MGEVVGSRGRREGLSQSGQLSGGVEPRASVHLFVRFAPIPLQVQLAVGMNESGVLLGSDVQSRRPSTRLSLSRVGVTDVEKVIRIRSNGKEQLFYAELECFVDLGREQKGAHMSRFEEIVNEAIDEVILSEAFKAETLASHIAERVRDRQDGCRAEVTIAARYPEHKPSPATGTPTQEIYTLFGSAVASTSGTRRLVGVQAQGMTACPCAQEMVGERSRERLREDGFTDDEITRVLEAVPVATHNQRGVGTLHVGCPEGCTESLEARVLLEIVEASMSSEIYELMKRPDEVHVVEKAHRHPRFVEDCVREMVRMATERFAGLGDDAFVSARQENLETIHKHKVVAERHGLMGELLREIDSGESGARQVTMREWLEAAPAR
jgi:GTP cyclohydrolase IV